MAKAAKPKKKIKRTDKTQSERFKKIAQELGADPDMAMFEAIFKKIAASKPRKKP